MLHDVLAAVAVLSLGWVGTTSPIFAPGLQFRGHP